MADVEEPQFTSLSARIAALNQSKNANGPPQHQTFGKRAPPPLPPSSAGRPAIPSRAQTANDPPIATQGPSVAKQANKPPIAVKANLLPPPPVDRDNPRPKSPADAARTPPLPARVAPPPLPGRKASQPSPALPPRQASAQWARRGSNDSTVSFSSTVSGLSLGQTVSSATSASSVESQRKLPPPLDLAKLPPLPPTRRELEEKAKANKPRLLTAKSATNLRAPPVVERDLAPKMPPRPRIPSRPSRNNLAEEEERPPPQPPRRNNTLAEDAECSPPQPPRRANTLAEDAERPPLQPPRRNNTLAAETAPAQPPRRLPPPAASRSSLSMGFNNKTETPNPAPRPTPTTYSRPSSPAVKELTTRDFDSVVMAGKPALVDFYAPYCKYCKELDPIWKQLGEDFAFASDKLTIAKVDVDAHKSFLSRFCIQGYPTIMFFDGNSETPETYQRMRELDSLTEFLEDKTGVSVADGKLVVNSGAPPPIPMSSKPSVAQVKAIQSRPTTATPTSGCLLCRDFSGPDQVASQYPRPSLPRSGDITGYLADVLCGPSRSATDKARAIFTWLHHNIAYDTGAFFGNNVKHVDPEDTIASGLAVCGGYAGLYVAIAQKAGLECVMVTGHGKGYGHTPLQPGERPPPRNPAGHAWNAVRIDGGEWKLIDACWGAGNVGNQTYNKKFTPSYFTMSNDDFGIKHFPADDAHFFRSDGRVQTWEKYMIGPIGEEPLQLYGAVEDHGLSPTSFTPAQKRIAVNSGEVVRFQFSKVCAHWDHERNGPGKPYCMVLKINGAPGRKEDFVPFESNDFWYWADVPARDLGAPGQGISVLAVTTVDGKEARGLSRAQYLAKKGRCGMSFGGVCAWTLI